ncbi:hypothetical protein DYB30_006114, partial [Aphanomyces astaci]
MDLTAQERSLLAWTASELERVLTAPVNQLRSKELQLRKAMLVFRDTKVAAVPAALLASWRTKLPSELKPEQREWVAMERVLHPDLYSTKLTPAVPTHWTKDKLLSLIQTPEEQISILPPKERHVRDLLWHYDNVFCLELITPKAVPVSHHAVNHTQQGMKVEVDIDLRCRLVQQELDRAMANPNDMMDSSILHSAPQRFPTQVLRLELEKELDRLLLSQLYERETAEWKALAASLDKTDDGDSSDSDPEAQIARLAKAKAAGKPQSGTKKATKPSFQKQKRAIQDTVVSSATCLTALRSGGGAVSFRKMDLFGELTMECRVWEKHLRLRAVDTELHAAYNWPGDHFETVALHGFTQMQQTEKVKAALTREQNTLVAQLVANEVMEDMLEFMLEGWVFGERESHTLASDPDELKDMNEAKAKFGTPFDKWTPIEVDAQATQRRGKAVQAGSAVATVLNETEQALKFGLFCMTLMYFRGLSLLQKQKNVWNTHASKPPPPTNKLDKPSLLQGERARQANRQRY